MKKRYISFLLVTIVLATSIVGCGNSSSSSNSASSVASTTQSANAAEKPESEDTASTESEVVSTGDLTADSIPTATSADKYTMKMHLSIGENDPVYASAKWFSDTVGEKTNGNVTVELYPSSSLGNTADCLEGLSLGICNIVYESIANLGSLSILSNIDAAPYLYTSVDHWKNVWYGDVGKNILSQIGDESNMEIMGAALQGVRVMCTNKKVSTPDDVKGFKLRVPTIPMYLDTWTWLGATPTPLGGSEVFTALQQGTVDGAENGMTNVYSLSWYEATKYITETNHVYATDSFIFDKDYFNSLPEDYQKIIRSAAEIAGQICTENVMQTAEENAQAMKDAGLEFIETDTTLWQDALDGFLEEKYPDLTEIAQNIKNADPAK